MQCSGIDTNGRPGQIGVSVVGGTAVQLLAPVSVTFFQVLNDVIIEFLVNNLGRVSLVVCK